MKKYLFIVILVILTKFTFAQQTYQFSQRHSDILEYNPSVCGSRLYSEIKLHHRTQWAGFEGAPSTNILSYDGTIGKNNGLGAYIISDKVDISSKSTFSLNYSYHIAFPKFNLSMGLGFSGTKYKLNGQDLQLQDADDNLIPTQVINSGFSPQAMYGMFAYNKDFYFGLSSISIFQTKVFSDYETEIPSTQIFFLMGAYNFVLNPSTKIIPNFVVEKSLIEKTNIEIGLKSEFYDKLFFGLNYRLQNSIVAEMGVFFIKHIAIAYSYDYILTDINNYSLGSHEIVLYFQIPYSKKRSNRLFEFENENKNELFLKW